MADILVVGDLPTAVQAAELVATMIAGANAKALRVAPCLGWTGTPDTEPEPSENQLAEAKLILIGAVQRWAEAGSGAFQQQTAGPFSVSTDTRQRSGFNLWPSEINDLQKICKSDTTGGAFSVDTAPSCSGHADICALAFGASYCSCGADIAGFPLYELYDGA